MDMRVLYILLSFTKPSTSVYVTCISTIISPCFTITVESRYSEITTFSITHYYENKYPLNCLALSPHKSFNINMCSSSVQCSCFLIKIGRQSIVASALRCYLGKYILQTVIFLWRACFTTRCVLFNTLTDSPRYKCRTRTYYLNMLN